MTQSDATLATLFVTRLYQAQLADTAEVLPELAASCRAAAADDEAGQAWSAKHGYPGYTSYASLDDLAWRFPAMKALTRQLDRHAKAFAKILDWDLTGGRLALNSLWINVLDPGGFHSGHIHPNSVISGTVYVEVPKGSSAIRFEDPRLPLMMATPPLKTKPAPNHQRFVSITPTAGTILLWESWLRHEVPLNRAPTERLSISFNYGWGEGG